MQTITVITGSGRNAEEYEIAVIPRTVFCEERFTYQAGEHVLFGGPTQNGKTTLAFDLLSEVIDEDLPAYVAVSKPVDKVSTKYGIKLGLPRIYEWPPPSKLSDIGKEKPNGYLVWPQFGDMETDIQRCAVVHRMLLRERYASAAKPKKNESASCILVMDDTVTKSKVMGLDQDMTTILVMAGAMGIGLWTFVQKPTGAGNTALWAYGNSEHVFLLNDPDRKNQLRYDEIGGFSPELVTAVTRRLKPFQALYLKRSGRHMCIVDKT